MLNKNNLAEVNSFKLLTKENLLFSLVYNFQKRTPNFRLSKVDFSTIKIASKKVRKNTVDISTREITLKKVRENNMDFSTS